MRERIINFQAWNPSAPGRYALAWEQAQCDAAVADLFGYHSLQLGWPSLDGLRANRMPHRWLALGEDDRPEEGTGPLGDSGAWHRLALRAEALALPLAPQSMDLLLLPHALETSPDPHAVLREAERVLVPEGRVLITGFNPLSFWGLHAWRTQWGAPWCRGRRPYLPPELHFVAYPRLRDWLHLLNFEVESARFGGYVPAVRSPAWLERWRWMDAAGERWWPIFGALYLVVAVKRVPGMRLLGPSWRSQATKRPAMALPAARQQPPRAASWAARGASSSFAKDGPIEPS